MGGLRVGWMEGWVDEMVDRGMGGWDGGGRNGWMEGCGMDGGTDE